MKGANNMLKNFANLIKVKTIVTFAVVGVWCYLAITGNIDTDYINNIVLMVIAFYFGTQVDKK